MKLLNDADFPYSFVLDFWRFTLTVLELLSLTCQIWVEEEMEVILAALQKSWREKLSLVWEGLDLTRFLEWKVLQDEGGWVWLEGSTDSDSRFLRHDDAMVPCQCNCSSSTPPKNSLSDTISPGADFKLEATALPSIILVICHHDCDDDDEAFLWKRQQRLIILVALLPGRPHTAQLIP